MSGRLQQQLLALGCAVWLAGCGGEKAGPQVFTAEEKEIIDAASRAVSQFEEWGGKAEYKIEKNSNGWRVTAWRVVHPEKTGNDRYVPWGYRIILLDRRGKVIEYKNSK